AYIAFKCVYRPKIEFSSPVVCLTEGEANDIQRPVLNAVLAKTGMNRNMPRAVIFGPHELGGLNWPNLYTEIGINHLKYLIGHIRMGDVTGKLMEISLAHLQLRTGSGRPALTAPIADYTYALEGTWIEWVWSFTSEMNASIELTDGWVPELQSVHDRYLMDIFRYMFTPASLKKINQCRLYLQVVTIADIASADGLSIEMAARQGSRNQYRVSKYTWPNQQQPSRAAWLEWKKALLRISHSDGRLHQSLGRWKDTRRRSQEFKICLSRDKQTLFCKEGKIWTQHNHAGGLRRPTYQRQGAICISAPPDALPASAKKETRVWGQVNCRDIQPAVTEKVHLLLREQFKSLPPVLKRLLGKYKIPADQGKNILLTIRRSTAIAVSDGSVKDGKGSHAWCVEGKNPSLGIEGVGPTDGGPERMSSFRAELHGVAAI
ncbi:MAG: hypothetical protein ACREOZ_01775, partial [Gloeomargaritales cyanobacterium]